MSESIKSKIGSGAVWLSGSTGIVQVIGLLYLFLVLSQLKVYEYGLIKLALSIPALMSPLALAGLHRVIISDLSQLKEEGKLAKARYLLSSFFSAKMILAVISFCLLFSATILFSNWFSDEILNLVRILSLSFLLGPIRSLILVAQNILHDFKGMGSFSVAEEGIKLVLTAVFLLGFDLGVTSVILAYVVSEVVVSLLYFDYILRFKEIALEGRLFSKGLLDPMSSLKNHAKWGIMLESFQNATTNLRPWIINFLLGMHAVGIYGLVVSLLGPIKGAVPLGKLILPILPKYKNDKKLLGKIINSSIKYKFYSMISLGLAAIMALPILFDYFPAYKDAYLLFILFTFSLIPNAISGMFSVFFHTFRLQKDLFIATFINAVAVAVLLPVSVLFFGIYGAAVEIFVTHWLFTYSRYISMKKVFPEYNFSIKYLFSFTSTDRWLFNKMKKTLLRRSSSKY